MSITFAPKIIALTFSMLLLATALATTASADDSNALVVDASAPIHFVGPPSATEVDSQFVYDKNNSGRLETIRIVTRGELVLGEVGTVDDCRADDDDNGAACRLIRDLLLGADISSLHTSVAYLTVSDVSTVDGAMLGLAPGPIEIVSGGLAGKLVGEFSIGSGSDGLKGSTNIRINRGSTGTYACFVGPLIAGLLTACELGYGAMLPIRLDVVDSGTFQIDSIEGTFAEAGLAKAAGNLRVTVDLPARAGVSVGAIEIISAVFVFRESDRSLPAPSRTKTFGNPSCKAELQHTDHFVKGPCRLRRDIALSERRG